MGLVYSSVVDAPRDKVFAWHGRPGALARLSPPWQRLRIVTEADSLQNGRAVLALPGGLRWVAQHRAEYFDPPRRFVDELSTAGLSSLPARLTVRWRHTHDFEEVGTKATRVIDRVDTPVPAIALRAMFAYRHRQLADDLAAHQRAAAHGLAPATVAVTGSSGLVGSALTVFLSTGGHRVIRLVRHPATSGFERQWNPDDPDPGILTGVDAVIHLAGSSIAGRFTDAHRRAIRQSRIGPTRRLAETIARMSDRGPTLVCASAIGYYGYDRGDEVLTEDSDRGDGFLADVVADWEDACSPAEQAGVRVVRVRTGIVQSPAAAPWACCGRCFAQGSADARGRRLAVAVLDRDRRPRRHLSPCPVGHRTARTRQRRRRRTGPQCRLHPHARPRPAQARGVAGATARPASVARRTGGTRTGLREPACTPAPPAARRAPVSSPRTCTGFASHAGPHRRLASGRHSPGR